VKYAFIEAHRHEHGIKTMCRVLKVCRSGFYAWVHQPDSNHAVKDRQLLELIRASWEASGGIYGSPRVHRDLMEAGERISRKRVARIMREQKIRAIRGYKKPKPRFGKPAVTAPNRLQQEFDIAEPNAAWVTDITYVRTWQGWLYLAVVIDLYSRRVIGWAMRSTLARELVLDAILMAVWQRKPKGEVIIHSDQGSQYGSDDWQRFCRSNKLVTSMSRRGNCYDNAVAESFFSSLKKERIRKKIYKTRQDARADLFDYIEVFYNRKRRHSHIGDVSPAAFEEAATKTHEVSGKVG
jgi:putative transposase